MEMQYKMIRRLKSCNNFYGERAPDDEANFDWVSVRRVKAD